MMPWALLCALIVLTSAAAVAGITTSESGQASAGDFELQFEGVPIDGFGGYGEYGNVNQVSAQWRVPTIRAGSSGGYARTVIDIGSDKISGPNIAVGTGESLESSTDVSPSDCCRPSYLAYWFSWGTFVNTDFIEAVQPSDLVSASMTRTADGWSVVFADLTQGSHETFEIHHDAHARFTFASWLQEDPSLGGDAVIDIDYPALTPSIFGNLELNRRPPTLDAGDRLALSTDNGVFDVPTPLHDDGFAMRPARGAALRYLNDVFRFNIALEAIEVQSEHWTRHTSRQLKVGVLDGYLLACNEIIAQLSASGWPPTAEQDIHSLIASNDQQCGSARAWGAAGFEGSLPTSAVPRGPLGPSIAASRVRADLGLPPD
jgi:hypothetical protein